VFLKFWAGNIGWLLGMATGFLLQAFCAAKAGKKGFSRQSRAVWAWLQACGRTIFCTLFLQYLFYKIKKISLNPIKAAKIIQR
jgi:hypothetical protein